MQEIKSAKDFQKGRRENLTRRWNLPAQNKNFIGRQNLLDQISERLSGSKPLVITACHGLGGVGKTQLVTEFAYRNEKKYERIIWIPSESTEQIEMAYLLLGQDLGIVPEKTPPAEAIHMVKTWLSNHPRNLVIFDNAENSETVQSYVLSSGADILITSRNTEWTGGIVVDVFSLEEAVEYFIKIVGERAVDTKEKIEELAEELGRLPLALAQATAYIRENKISIQSYLDLYQEKKAYLLSLSVLPESDHHAAVYVTWDITMERIKQESVLAPALLTVCSYLHSEKIPEILLKFFSENKKYNSEGKEFFEEATGCLRNYSMVSVDEEAGDVSVHRLVQEVTQLKLNSEEREQFLNVVFDLCVHCYPYAEEKDKVEDIALKRVFLRHLEVMLPRVRDERKKISLLRIIQDAFGVSGFADKRREICEKLLALVHRWFGTDCEDSLIAYHSLGLSYFALGNYRQALKHYERELEILKRLNVPENFGFAKCLLNLSNVYWALGDRYKQRELLERALVIGEKELGANDPKLTMILSNLALVYDSFGQVHKELELLERALAIDERHYGQNHPEVAIVLVGLSHAHGSMGNAHKMREFSERALKIKEFYYGSDHIEITDALSNLGLAHGDLGDHNKKCELLERSLKIQEQYYGPDHYAVAMTLGNLTIAYGSLGRFNKQREISEKALRIVERHFGPGACHPEVALTLSNAGNAQVNLGNPHQAKDLFERALHMYSECYGPTHPEVALMLNNIGAVYGELGNVAKQREFFERSLKITESNCGPNHPSVARVLVNLSNTYEALGDKPIAQVLLERALKITKDYYGPRHPMVAQILQNYALMCFKEGKIEKARECFSQAYEVCLQHPGVGPNHPLTKQIYSFLIQIASALQRGHVAPQQSSSFWSTSIQSVEDYLRLAVKRRNEKKHDESIACIDMALALSPEHPAATFQKARYLFEQRNYRDALKFIDVSLAHEGNEERKVVAAELRAKICTVIQETSRLQAKDTSCKK